ncbi:hypothetical protein KDD93_04410 [Campylobacter sp. faydin G-24]|uniref:Transformation system protein n=1 Tax=Campylobacter anatolicus TaxID=2829105 RepID=A0ABS5HHT6_9BACT|nr:hypothetical protein [Campylobacter anatolicus]MBR8462064.1 hypothetical protein [Campylobacter anatolicus]MBR8463818.1 hypothetical protein [Campylobacter anatolicus]MBR8464849.1 hypothetical protein [Campylobacter anatolicus]
MSKKDTSLENIDIAKLLLYILIFIVVCLVIIFAFLVPNIKEYRGLTRENNSQIAAYTKIKQIFDTKFNTLEMIKERDKFIISSYDVKFNKTKFINFASTYFNEVSLNEVSPKDSNESFFRYQLNVTTSMNTPQKFYDFLDALSKYESIVRTDFPITMKGENDKIHTSFNIRVYGLK